MKNLIRVTILASLFIALNANASVDIQSIELDNATIINATDVSAITLYNNDSSIESIETFSGEVIKGNSIKKINFLKSKLGNGPGINFMSMKHGGDDSGG